MRRSTRTSMATGMSLDSALSAAAATSTTSTSTRRVSTRRSSILPPPPPSPSLVPAPSEDSRNTAGNFITKFSMTPFVNRVKELTDDQRAAIENVGFGYLLRIPHHTLKKNLLVELMDRWDCEKRAFAILGRELTLSPIDAALILGLPSSGSPIILNDDEPFSTLEEEYGATPSNRKISVSVVERRLKSLGDSSDEDFIRTFLLFTFGTLLFHDSTAKIDSRYLSVLNDLDQVASFSWGVAVVEDLTNWLCRWKEEQVKNMEGCLILLQIWSYEHLDIGRPNLLDPSFEFPRASRWESSRSNSQRQWFIVKFDELEEDQVTWKLEPTEAELHVDLIKKVFETQPVGKGAQRPQSSRPSAGCIDSTIITAAKPTQCLKLPPKSTRRKTIVEVEPKGDGWKGKQNQENISGTCMSEAQSDITVECTRHVASSNLQQDRKDQNAEKDVTLQENYQVLKREYAKLKEDMTELRRENLTLKNQLFSKPTSDEDLRVLRKENEDLKEENKDLKEENEDLKEENDRLRSCEDVISKMEMMFHEYDTEFEHSLIDRNAQLAESS